MSSTPTQARASSAGSTMTEPKTPEERASEPPPFEDVVAALLQVDPTGIVGQRARHREKEDGRSDTKVGQGSQRLPSDSADHADQQSNDE